MRYVRGIAWHRGGDFVVGRYDHRKLWIVDGEVAYIGGYTVSDEMRDNMFDLEWVLRGPVVAQLQASFLLGMGYAKAPLADFTECPSKLGAAGCPSIGAERYRAVLDGYFPSSRPRDPSYARELTIVQNNPLVDDARALGVTRFYHRLVDEAEDHLQLAAPFFTSEQIVDEALERYRARGCRLKIDVLFPKRPEHMMIWGRKSRHQIERLVTGAAAIRASSCGGEGEEVVAKVFRGDGACADYGKRGRLHGKVLLSDDWVSVGSANLDGVSLERNLELNVVSRDPELIERVSREFFRLGGSDTCGETMAFGGAAHGSSRAASRTDAHIDEITFGAKP
jgi:phosphatidylserine/phosphatidylglycerophosphate/cardiolipin synthase-like enzyme